MASDGSCFMVMWNIIKTPHGGGRPNSKPLGDHGTLNAHIRNNKERVYGLVQLNRSLMMLDHILRDAIWCNK